MPPTHTDEGLQAAHEIRARHSRVGILILSQFVEAGTVNRLIGQRASGLGYLLNDRLTDIEDFVATLHRVAEGGSALDPKVLAQLFAAHRSNEPSRESHDAPPRIAHADERNSDSPHVEVLLLDDRSSSAQQAFANEPVAAALRAKRKRGSLVLPRRL